jgi:hypothetical protein
MKNLPILSTDDIERNGLMSRIALSNRPSLDVDLEYIDAIAADLATDDKKRKIFVDDPTAYLSMRDLPISDCRLVASDVSLTSGEGWFPKLRAEEAWPCTAVAICNFAVLVNAVTKANVVNSANAANVANAANAAVAVNLALVRTSTYTTALHTEENFLLAKPIGPYDTHGVL